MTHLADTNLLLRWTQPQTSEHQTAVNAVARLRSQGETIVIIPQCLIEFWAVASRPINANGLGLPLTDVYQELQSLQQLFPLLPDNALIYPAWENLVSSVGVSGKQVHDARLVAAMQVHGISHILTFNGGDFVRFQNARPGITIIDPGSV